MKFLIGIDEAGRGPLAGPVAVGVVKVARDFDWNLIEGVGDSKQISAKKRGVIFHRAKALKEEGKLDFVVTLVAASVIDKKGIARAIALAIARAIKRLEVNPKESFIKLDGALRAPSEFSQETIIKGDSKEKVIGLASIVAKETRDAYMVRKSAEQIFAPYDFDIHKGYGTKNHRHVIKRLGLTAEHRKTFCQNRNIW